MMNVLLQQLYSTAKHFCIVFIYLNVITIWSVVFYWKTAKKINNKNSWITPWEYMHGLVFSYKANFVSTIDHDWIRPLELSLGFLHLSRTISMS